MPEGAREYEVTDVARWNIPYATSIGRRQLGIDYIGTTDFLEAMSAPGQFCKVAVRRGREVLGFALCREFGPEGIDRELDLPECRERTDLLSAERIGLLDSVAVDRGRHGRGIGSALTGACVDRFAADGCDVLVCMAWVHTDGKEPIGRALAGNGFEPTGLSIEGYWNRWVDTEGGHICPVCGFPCACSARLWTRSLRHVRLQPVPDVPVDLVAVGLVDQLVPRALVQPHLGAEALPLEALPRPGHAPSRLADGVVPAGEEYDGQALGDPLGVLAADHLPDERHLVPVARDGEVEGAERVPAVRLDARGVPGEPAQRHVGLTELLVVASEHRPVHERADVAGPLHLHEDSGDQPGEPHRDPGLVPRPHDHRPVDHVAVPREVPAEDVRAHAVPQDEVRHARVHVGHPLRHEVEVLDEVLVPVAVREVSQVVRGGLPVAEVVVPDHGEAARVQVLREVPVPGDVLYHPVGYLEGRDRPLDGPLHAVQVHVPPGRGHLELDGRHAAESVPGYISVPGASCYFLRSNY